MCSQSVCLLYNLYLVIVHNLFFLFFWKLSGYLYTICYFKLHLVGYLYTICFFKSTSGYLFTICFFKSTSGYLFTIFFFLLFFVACVWLLKCSPTGFKARSACLFTPVVSSALWLHAALEIHAGWSASPCPPRTCIPWRLAPVSGQSLLCWCPCGGCCCCCCLHQVLPQ